MAANWQEQGHDWKLAGDMARKIERLTGALRVIRKTHQDHEDRCLWCGKPWPCADYRNATEALGSDVD